MGEHIESHKPSLPDSSLRWIVGALAVGLLVTGGIVVYSLRPIKPNTAQSAAPPSIQPDKGKITAVSALGRITPQGEIFKLSPSPTMGGAKIDRILVREGDQVKAGQAIAVLDNYERKMAAMITAREAGKVAQANLEIIAAGAKKGEIQAQAATVERTRTEFQKELAINQAALEGLIKELEGEQLEQKANINRLQAELRQSEQDFRRYRKLADDGAIALADLEQRGLTMVAAQQQLSEAQARLLKTEATLAEKIREQRSLLEKEAESMILTAKEAQATLAKISEVREVDIEKAKAELNLALAQFNEAKAELETTIVKAPVDAQVLKIYVRAGEKVSDANGVADLGRTAQMMVIAEVYESDVARVQPGQMAVITSENGSFPGELGGQVHHVGLQVGKNDVLETDPAADVDARVVEVKIKLTPEASRTVAGLSNANVLVKIIP